MKEGGPLRAALLHMSLHHEVAEARPSLARLRRGLWELESRG